MIQNNAPKLHWSKLTHIARCYSIEGNVHVMIGMVCVCVGGEEQSEPHLEEVHYSSSDVLLQWPGKTAEGSTSWTLPVLKQRFSSIAVTWPLLLLQVDCSDHDSDGSHDLIGSFTTKVSELQKAGHGSPVSSLRKMGCDASWDCGLVVGPLNSLILCQVQFECIHPEKQKKKKSYKNSGVVSVKNCKVESTLPRTPYFLLLLAHYKLKISLNS